MGLKDRSRFKARLYLYGINKQPAFPHPSDTTEFKLSEGSCLGTECNRSNNIGCKSMYRRILLLLPALALFFNLQVQAEELLEKVKIKEVDASSVQMTDPAVKENFDAKNIKDGANWTRWSSRFYDDQWLVLTFRHPVWVRKVNISWQDAYAKSYDIEVMNNSGQWVRVYSNDESDGGEDTVEITPVLTGKLRVFCNKRATEWGFSIWELEVFGVKSPVAA